MSNEVNENLIANERREFWMKEFSGAYTFIPNADHFENLSEGEPPKPPTKGDWRKSARRAAIIADCALEQFDKRFPAGGAE